MLYTEQQQLPLATRATKQIVELLLYQESLPERRGISYISEKYYTHEEMARKKNGEAMLNDELIED